MKGGLFAILLLVFPLLDGLGIYIHLPFCRRRCHYCDFPIQVVGDRSSNIILETTQYAQVLMTDIGYTLPFYLNALLQSTSSKGRIAVDTVDTVYFGGGTPSLFNAACKFNI